MDPITRLLMQGSAGAGKKLYVEDVFSTWLYTGNGSTQTITNGIDLSGEGGLVWIKQRSGTEFHRLTDTLRGPNNGLRSNSTAADNVNTTMLTAFNTDGFSLGSNTEVNGSGSTYASWTFRKAAKFFDVVTYTGDGNASKTISHNLGSTPGFLIVKRTDSTGQWQCYHRGLTSTNYYIQLNQTTAQQTLGSQVWGVSSTNFTVYGAATDTNINGATYVAYLFAHDAGGFGDSGNESVIKCGSFTTNGSGNATVDLGWEPQWVLYKRSDSAQTWAIADNMRGMTTTANAHLYPNSSDAEFNNTGFFVAPTATGFQATATVSATYVYIAIRRGPMKTPTVGTEVFSVSTGTYTPLYTDLSYNWAFSTDAILYKGRNTSSGSDTGGQFADRLRGFAKFTSYTTSSSSTTPYLLTTSTNTESVSVCKIGIAPDAIGGNGSRLPIALAFGTPADSNSSGSYYGFRRAPGFFDVVAFTGTGSTLNLSHNLNAVPELIITKKRVDNTGTGSNGWIVMSSAYPGGFISGGSTSFSQLQSDAATVIGGGSFLTATPTSTVFSLFGTNYGNTNTFITYLFASCPGVSKVGSYTGTGTTQQIDCGFTSGARFVLIKRIDSTGDWFVYDTARGIVSGNDPYLLLNSTAAEVTNTDYIDPLNSGFELSTGTPSLNASGGNYLFLAIA